MNPNQIVNALLQNNPNLKQNPIMQNAFQMMQKGDEKGLQQLVQNVAQSKGVDINQLASQVKQKFGL